MPRDRYVDIISLADFLAGIAYWARQGVDLKWESIGPEVDTKEKANSDVVVLARDYTTRWSNYVFAINSYVRKAIESRIDW